MPRDPTDRGSPQQRGHAIACRPRTPHSGGEAASHPSPRLPWQRPARAPRPPRGYPPRFDPRSAPGDPRRPQQSERWPPPAARAQGALRRVHAARRGRDGRRVPGGRHRPQPPGRHEDRAPPRRPARVGAGHAVRHGPAAGRRRDRGQLRRDAAALPARGHGHGAHGAPGRHPGVRARADRVGRPVLHDAVRARAADPARRHGRGEGPRGAVGAPRAVPEDLRHPRVRARAGDHPPRPQARERGARGVRRGDRPRLGPREDPRARRHGRAADGDARAAGVVGQRDDRGRARHAGLHGAGGVGGRARPGGRAQRRVRPRGDALRAAHGAAAVRHGQRGAVDGAVRARGRAARPHRRCVGARGARGRVRGGAGAGPCEASPDGGRAGGPDPRVAARERRRARERGAARRGRGGPARGGGPARRSPRAAARPRGERGDAAPRAGAGGRARGKAVLDAANAQRERGVRERESIARKRLLGRVGIAAAAVAAVVAFFVVRTSTSAARRPRTRRRARRPRRRRPPRPRTAPRANGSVRTRRPPRRRPSATRPRRPRRRRRPSGRRRRRRRPSRSAISSARRRS